MHYANATYTNLDGISGNFVINNDINITSSTGVTLNMDIAWAVDMRFWNTPGARDLAAWVSYNTTSSTTLTATDGIKTVYAAFRNSTWDIVNISDEIILNEAASLPFSGWLTLWLDASDASTITETGWDISIWNDKSPNWYNARQNTPAITPDLLTNEIDFNGSSEFFYLEGLSYTSANPLDGLLVCGVFKTNHVSSSYNDNWALLDFDRSEWFDFYNKWWDYGFSYDSDGTIRDVTTTGVGINDNSWHVACSSYDNSQINETIITVNWTTEFSWDLEPINAQIWVSQATRFGFIGDGSEAATENAGRNSIYYDGWIWEMVYFDSAITALDRKDLECYLGAKWWVDVAGCPWINNDPIASISYNIEAITSSSVIATLENESEAITITNNAGSNSFEFSSNGSFTFSFEDGNGNTGSSTATVDWIDPSAPSLTHTGGINEAPIITSHSGTGSISLVIASGATDITTISAVDTVYNIVWEYGTATLSGNTWTAIANNEMCNQVTTVSHRGDVNGETQRAPRVRSKTGTGFEVKVDNYDSTIWAISTDIDYIVMTAWIYDFGWWLAVEAGSNTTTAVACNASNSPTPDAVTFSASFSSAPAVIHTIATENDPIWVVSGVNGNSGNRWSEPTTTDMGVVLQRSFNACTAGSEELDYIAFEPGHYTLSDGSIFDALRSTDSIASVTATWNPINFSSAFDTTPSTVLVSQLWEDGWNGWYAQIHTGGWISASQVFATIDEDGPAADRNHTAEVAAAVAFDQSSGQFWEENTVSYSITGGSDSADFTINPTTGKLDFITGKDPGSPTDSNTDGIYEVEISACDSHCNSGCSTQTIFANVGDGIDPSISATNFASGSLLPGWNHSIVINYSDSESWIDDTSASITLHKWDWVSAYGSDLSGTWITIISETVSEASYTTNSLSSGKYQYRFSIDDLAGNTSIQDIDFYIDIPEFIIGTGSIDMWTLSSVSNSFSDTITITVSTIWAWFDVIMNRSSDLSQWIENIASWDGSSWYGYQQASFSWTISTINTNQNITTQANIINTNGDKNIYSYDIQIWALILPDYAAGEYEGNLDFWINFNY